MRDRFKGSDDASRLRFHTQTGGVTLTAQQPMNNVVRVTVQALAAVLGGTQSLHTNGYDEALALPTEESARLALRTQQILAAESGVANTADPLAGSYYVESLTTQLEQRAADYLAKVDELGGAARAIGFFQEEIEKTAYEHQLAVERKDREVVGVNIHTTNEPPMRPETAAFKELEITQTEKVRAFKAKRSQNDVENALRNVRSAAQSDTNLMPPLVDAVKTGATIGEISDVLRDVWGTYRAVAG
jgi:methylmalonyl-CoA mutase N-terminal domain/subunit